MMRGSSFLLEKSVRNYKNLVTAISEMNPRLWEIDVETYSEESISLLLNCKQQIISALGKENKLSDTLITKIMLGFLPMFLLSINTLEKVSECILSIKITIEN